MKAFVKVQKEVDIQKIVIDIHIRHVGGDDGDVPDDFPLLNGTQWKATVMVDSGHIIDWPEGEVREMFAKVCDAGVYTLIDSDGEVVAIRDNYVPNDIVPGEYGDYVSLKISGDGVITNWPESPSVDEFFAEDED